MINFKQYLKRHLRENVRTLICIYSVVLVLTFAFVVDQQVIHNYYQGALYSIHYNATLYIPTMFLCILAYVLPVTEFSFFKKRNHLDCVYSLPISRKAMGTVHYLTGLIILFSAFSLSYLLNFILLLSHGTGLFHFIYLVPHYFLCLLLGFIMYSFMVFVFNEANTKGDGIWFMILYTFVFSLSTMTISPSIEKYIDESDFVPWGTIQRMTEHYEYLVEPLRADYIYHGNWGSLDSTVAFVFWVIVGIASAIGFFLTFGRKRMERTEEISNSFFGYRTLIPIYVICLLMDGAFANIYSVVIVELFTLIGYTIYRRGFHYKKSDIAVLCLYPLLALLFSIV